MGPAQGTLLRICGLIPLLETAAVGDTTEDGGNKLWVIHIAESVEQRILLAEIDVHSRVKGITLLPRGRSIGEIG